MCLLLFDGACGNTKAAVALLVKFSSVQFLIESEIQKLTCVWPVASHSLSLYFLRLLLSPPPAPLFLPPPIPWVRFCFFLYPSSCQYSSIATSDFAFPLVTQTPRPSLPASLFVCLSLLHFLWLCLSINLSVCLLFDALLLFSAYLIIIVLYSGQSESIRFYFISLQSASVFFLTLYTLFYSIMFCTVLLCASIILFVLIYFILDYSALLYSVPFCPVLLSSSSGEPLKNLVLYDRGAIMYTPKTMPCN